MVFLVCGTVFMYDGSSAYLFFILPVACWGLCWCGCWAGCGSGGRATVVECVFGGV